MKIEKQLEKDQLRFLLTLQPLDLHTNSVLQKVNLDEIDRILTIAIHAIHFTVTENVMDR